MEYIQVKMHLKSGILASIWHCKMQGFQSFQQLCPLDPHQCLGHDNISLRNPWILPILDMYSHEKVMNSDIVTTLWVAKCFDLIILFYL